VREFQISYLAELLGYNTLACAKAYIHAHTPSPPLFMRREVYVIIIRNIYKKKEE